MTSTRPTRRPAIAALALALALPTALTPPAAVHAQSAGASAAAGAELEVVARLLDPPRTPIPCGYIYFRQVLRYQLVRAELGASPPGEVFAVHSCGSGGGFHVGGEYRLWLRPAAHHAGAVLHNPFGARARPLFDALRAVAEPAPATTLGAGAH